MVAYSFKRMFVDPIRDGSKRQTIRNERKRDARPGEQLQLYCAQRTKHCFLIGRATCVAILPIRLIFRTGRVIVSGRAICGNEDLDAFARRDGFECWQQMRAFWYGEHHKVIRGKDPTWSGIIITWRDFTWADAPRSPRRRSSASAT